MKRKIFISIIFSVLCVFSALGLSACGDNKIEITQDYVIECLEKIPNIVDIESATEYNDPNGQLNKDGGYIAHVYFSVDVINQDEIIGVTLVDKGTDAGGSIEVYRNAKDAEKRNTYLSSFDGTVLSSGSHKVYETCVIRTSDELTASQQNILENNIIKALSKSTESFVSMDTYLIQVAKELAEKDNLSGVETVIKLVELGYPTAKVEQVIADSNIDWGKIASKKAESFADYYATVYPVMITDLLLDNGFTDKEIEYAIENANIDWQYYAKIHAKSFLNAYEGEYLCPNDILGHLSFDKGYTVPDCEIALASCDVNWNNKAVEYIEYIDSEGEYATKSMYIDDLLSVEFTTAQAKYAVDNCGKNWNNKALSNLDYYVNTLSATPPNKTQCITQLKNWGFYDSEIDYAINNFDGIIYPDNLNYTVTFNPNEGELSIRTLNVIFGKSVTLPTPTRSGYSFVGWYNGQTKVESGVWYIAENVTLTATWEQTKFAISYNLDGGKNHSDNPAFYTINDSVTLKEPTKTGNDFIGWTFTGQTTPIKNVSISVGTKGEKNYTANWSPKTYTVTYDATGGTPAKNSEQVVFGSYFKPTTATKTGYDFNGWFYNGNEEYSNDYYNIASDITLSARWNNKGFWINYNANGGEVVSVQQRVFYDKTYEMYDTTRVGYKFLGWYNGTTKIENGTWKRLSDLNVTASWQALSYTISYNPDNGSSLESDTVFYDEYITLPTPTREGYTFSGWYNNGRQYTSGKWTTAKNIELEAYWTANSNTPYIVNHYQQNIVNDDYTLYNTQNLTGATDTYVWPSVKTYTGFTSPSSKRVQILPNGSLVVDYYYIRNSYTISFVSNGGNSIDNVTQKYQSNLNLLEGERTNFTFGGWFEDKDLSNEFTLATMPATNKTLYAWWSEENKPTDFVYSGIENLTIKEYVGESSTMWIPTYINDVPIIKIATQSFLNNSVIEKAVVPNSVISIGKGAFKGCTNLVDISLPFVGASETATVEYEIVFGFIFDYELYNNSGNQPENTVIQYGQQAAAASYYISYCFYIPKTIKTVSITKQQTIPNRAFLNCDFIENLYLPNNITNIGASSFSNCKSLTNIYIPLTVTKIGADAFKNCTSITISCQALEQPTGWNSKWNSSNCTVYWNTKQ